MQACTCLGDLRPVFDEDVTVKVEAATPANPDICIHLLSGTTREESDHLDRGCLPADLGGFQDGCLPEVLLAGEGSVFPSAGRDADGQEFSLRGREMSTRP